MTSPLSPEEFRAAAEVHRELGPEYDKAVVESFLSRLTTEIDARVDARLREREWHAPAPRSKPAPSGIALALGSIALGIPITAIVVAAGDHPVGFMGVLIVWLAIAAINVAYALRGGREPDSRG